MENTAYQAKEEDVAAVLRRNSLAVANTMGKCFESIADEVFGKLDIESIEQVARFGDTLGEQTDYAHDEIARQLRQIGVLEPLDDEATEPQQTGTKMVQSLPEPGTLTEAQEQPVRVSQDAILVFEAANGAVEHCFCTKAEATERLDRAVAAGSGGSLFAIDDLAAELVYAVAPNVRERVEEAKRKLKSDLAIRDALNRYGVPADRDLRVKIKRAIDDLRASVLRPVL